MAMPPTVPAIIYLGDGVYANIDNGIIALRTGDGISWSQAIYLEPEVMQALFDFAKNQGFTYG